VTGWGSVNGVELKVRGAGTAPDITLLSIKALEGSDHQL